MSKKRRFGGAVKADVDRQRKEASGYGYLTLPDNIKVFKPDGGTDYFDIIPYVVKSKHHPDANPDIPDSALPGEWWYKRPYWVHRDVGVDGETIVCPKSVGERCPICDYRDDELKKGTDWEDLKELKAKLRNLYVVVPINHKEFKEEMHIMDYSQYLFQNQLNAELEERGEEDWNFPSPDEGKTLRVRWTEKAFGDNSFYEAGRIDFEDRDQQYDEQWVEDAPCLDDMLDVYSYKKLSAMLHGLDEDDVVTETASEPEPEHRTRTTRKAKTAVSDDKKEKPARRTRRRTEPEPEPEAKTRTKRRQPESESEPESTRQPRRRRQEDKSVQGFENKCPFGLKFGDDWDSHDDCETCNTEHSKTFDACGDEYEAKNK